MKQLGSPDQTVTSIGHDVGLRITPSFQCEGPLLRALEIEDLAAGVENTAEHASCVQGGDFASRDGDHGFIQQSQTLFDLSFSYKRAALALEGESHEVFVVKSLCDSDSLFEV